MKTLSIFEDFSGGVSASRNRFSEQSDPLEGYETGYQAGWDDAIKAQQESQAHLTSTLSQNLEQIEFTLIEAQTQLLASIRPVMEEITATLLPGLSNEGLRALVVAEIDSLLKTSASKDISLVVSDQDETTIAAFLDSSRTLSEISMVVKDTLGEGQVYISCAELQRKIDVGQAMSDIQSTIENFLKQPELEQVNAR